MNVQCSCVCLVSMCMFSVDAFVQCSSECLVFKCMFSVHVYVQFSCLCLEYDIFIVIIQGAFQHACKFDKLKYLEVSKSS